MGWMMAAALPKGWKEWVTRDKAGKGTLTIYCSGDEDAWVDWSLRFWDGDIPNREMIKEHPWGGYVCRGSFLPDQEPHYFKRFSIRNLRYLHKPRRARYSLLHEARLRDAGFRTPCTVAIIESRRMGILLDSAIITKPITHAFRMFDLINKEDTGPPWNMEKKRNLLYAFGEEAGRLHSAGFYHGDMHWGNIFCRMEEDRFVFIWTDNERGRRYERLPFRWRVDDLNQVNKYRHRLSRTDRMRMWHGYLKIAALPDPMADHVLKRVIERSRTFWRKRGWLGER